MELNSEPIVTTNRKIASLRYAIINCGGQSLISRTEVLGMMHSERGVSAFPDSSDPPI